MVCIGLQLYKFYFYSLETVIAELESCPCFTALLALQLHNGASHITVAVIPRVSITVLAALLKMHRENADASLEVEKINCFSFLQILLFHFTFS